ncbi:Carbonic anhydrase [Anatilimnocola aggregata]|uniref:Carbonic anhydrase n=1 Tax=Anatilimnocola aggregata TaxID=2528021 RepID=A0A517Y9A3_9BACT|nr:carbonic anhydrase [Anatilimnocola aggregata]QDU26805.1 Carbonic anhydrase [Anatilimnocola aggregata]
MQNLVKGVHYFQNIGFQQQQKLFEQLAEGQAPEACFITCSDSRIDPNLITNSAPGSLFIVRNVGNLIPCYGTSNNGEMAAVEYAVTALGVKHIIVCGHTACGAMRAVVEGGTAEKLPAVTNWLRHADSTGAIVKEHYQHLSGAELITAAAQENVLVQLEHLRTAPVIATKVSRGQITLHGWMYKIETGQIFAYDSAVHEFRPVLEVEDGSDDESPRYRSRAIA